MNKGVKLMSSWLEVENVSKVYDTVTALKGISFKIEKQNIIGLIGPNGAGKTTLLHILLGLIKCDSGNCRILGYDAWDESKKLRSKLGVLLERPSYPSGISVKEYLNYIAKLYECEIKHSEYKWWGERLNLPLNRNIAALSTGMRRKLGILTAIITKPEIIVMDEPTVNIDPISREIFLEIIMEIQKEYGGKIIISSHLLYDLEKFTDVVIILNDGLIVEKGDTLEVMSRYTKSNMYTCVSLDSNRLKAILETEPWINSIKKNLNHLIIKTEDIKYHLVFIRITEIAREHRIQLLTLNRLGSLVNVLQRENE